MSDYIKREDAIDALYGYGKSAQDIIKRIPAADVVKRKHGKWERNCDGIFYWWECSECHHDAWYDEEDLTNFCPNCGARMVTDDV